MNKIFGPSPSGMADYNFEIKQWFFSNASVTIGLHSILDSAYALIVNINGDAYDLESFGTKVNLSENSFTTCVYPGTVTNSAIFLAQCD